MQLSHERLLLRLNIIAGTDYTKGHKDKGELLVVLNTVQSLTA